MKIHKFSSKNRVFDGFLNEFSSKMTFSPEIVNFRRLRSNPVSPVYRSGDFSVQIKGRRRVKIGTESEVIIFFRLGKFLTERAQAKIEYTKKLREIRLVPVSDWSVLNPVF